MFRSVRKREVNRRRTEIFVQTCRLARKLDVRGTSLVIHYLYIVPGKIPAPSGFQRFQHRFFGSKAGCI